MIASAGGVIIAAAAAAAAAVMLHHAASAEEGAAREPALARARPLARELRPGARIACYAHRMSPKPGQGV